MPLNQAEVEKLQAAAELVGRRTQSNRECYPCILEHLLIPLLRDVSPGKLMEAHLLAQQQPHTNAKFTRVVDASAALAVAVDAIGADAVAPVRADVDQVLREAVQQRQRTRRATHKQGDAYSRTMLSDARLAWDLVLACSPIPEHDTAKYAATTTLSTTIEEYDARAARTMAWLVEGNMLTVEMEVMADMHMFPHDVNLSRSAPVATPARRHVPCATPPTCMCGVWMHACVRTRTR